jgi:hypothetical protein
MSSNNKIVTKNFEITIAQLVDLLSNNVSAMGQLVRAVSIEQSHDIRDVKYINHNGECRILYNLDFVNNHCANKIEFSMLILHELYHLLLDDTFTFDNSTESNLAKDAIINSIITNIYRTSMHRSFFMKLYDKEAMPEAFLRPNSRPKGYRTNLKYKLFQSSFGLESDELTDIIRESLADNPPDALPKTLGSHGASETFGRNLQEKKSAPNVKKHILEKVAVETKQKLLPVMKEAVKQKRKKLEKRIKLMFKKEDKISSEIYNHRKAYYDSNKTDKEIVEKIEQLQNEMQDLANERYQLQKESRELDVNEVFKDNLVGQIIQCKIDVLTDKNRLQQELMKVSLQTADSKIVSEVAKMYPVITDKTVVPNYRDRRATFGLATGIYTPFYKNYKTKKDFGACIPYVDVSGSMNVWVETIYSVINSNQEFFNDIIYLFSTSIYPVTKDEFKEGKRGTGWGTDDCWIEHAVENGFSKLVVFTDGWFAIGDKNLEALEKSGAKIVLALTNGNFTKTITKVLKNVLVSTILLDKYGRIEKFKG